MRRDRHRVVVCGTKFGRVYVDAIARGHPRFELAGIVAAGSARSAAVARRHGVPLVTDLADLSPDVDVACVVVSAAVNGGPGTELALHLLERGVHVVQEHPVFPSELEQCFRAAREAGVVYQLNTHYPFVAPVRAFLEAARTLREQRRVLFVDGACSLQLKYSFFDVVGRAIGRLRPWAFGDGASRLPAEVEALAASRPAFTTLDGVIGGVPVTVRLQNQLHASDPDNHAHVYHRLTVGTDGGSLSLVDTHGPVVWTPRPHIPQDVQRAADPSVSDAPSLAHETSSIVGPPGAPSWRSVMTDIWPEAVARSLDHLDACIDDPAAAARAAQYHLSLARLVQDATDRFGPPQLLRDAAPEPLAVAALAPSS